VTAQADDGGMAVRADGQIRFTDANVILVATR
jgi:hypothetical protein